MFAAAICSFRSCESDIQIAPGLPTQNQREAEIVPVDFSHYYIYFFYLPHIRRRRRRRRRRRLLLLRLIHLFLLLHISLLLVRLPQKLPL